MFEQRLRILLVCCALAVLVVVGRLFQIQVVQASYYRDRAHRALMLRPEQLPFIRGSILDRTGEILVSDEASWDICMDFDAIAASIDPQSMITPEFLTKLKRWYRAGEGDPDEIRQRLTATFATEIKVMWDFLATLDIGESTPSSRAIRDKAHKLHDRIKAVRSYLARVRGFDDPIREEKQAHAVLPGLTADAQIYARERISRFPWLHVRDASSRTFAPDTESFAHVLGRMGRAQAAHLVEDPDRDDKHRRYLADEPIGIMGIEKTGERMLRGRRGQIRFDRDGNILAEHSFEPMHGHDVRLTIHAPLQRKLFAALRDRVNRIPDSPGGAIVVIDVTNREILALVSYPSYDPELFNEDYEELSRDSVGLPLTFRAAACAYAPGSTIKPLVCLEGLTSGVINMDTHETCTGYLFEEVRNAWRCWPIAGSGQRMRHGTVSVVEALKGSCNIFMYRLGDRLGVDRICGAFDMVGIGRTTGTGLIEESEGLNPDRAWLERNARYGITPGKARHFAMGQAEILMTPMQVANVMATYADGRYQQLSIVQSNVTRPAWDLPCAPKHLLAIKTGMYQVVNASDGTAFKTAFLDDPRWAICGKTGSATVSARPSMYRIPFIDEGEDRVARIPATSRKEATDKFLWDHPRATFDPGDIKVVEEWPARPPDDGGGHSHAWFGAFLQRVDASGRPLWSETPRYAFSVLVEFGGSGGRTSGPLAKQVASTLIEMFERPRNEQDMRDAGAVP
ncbi:MAG: penicillin-binding transpeptidase domain-containing protein [Planctomycetota bacterium]|jgi:cell division protein FtsI/penicillin-binding protein 2